MLPVTVAEPLQEVEVTGFEVVISTRKFWLNDRYGVTGCEVVISTLLRCSYAGLNDR